MWDKLRRTSRAEGTKQDAKTPSASTVDSAERLVDVGVDTDDDAALRQGTYEAWAERLRTHKQDKLADVIGGTDAVGADSRSCSDPDEPTPEADNWSPESLQHGGPDLALLQPNEMTNQELLASLGLSVATTDKEIQRTYRRLVMEHHPDRWQNADDATRQQHEERLLHVTALYNELRSRGR